MSVRNIVLILAALLIMGTTGLLARAWINAQRAPVTAAAPAAPSPKVEAAMVLVAATDLPSGTLLKETDLRWQAWPEEALSETYFVKPKAANQPDPLKEIAEAGAVVRRGISAGEPLTKGRIIKPGERGFLAAVLRPGYRAVSVQVNPTSGISGLVFPGDRVDLILTHTIKRGKINRRASETVLTNVRVLAIDQTTNDQNGGPRLFKNATLELTPKQAEMLAVVSEIGKLSLSLRSLAKDEAELERLVESGAPLAEPDPERGKTYTWDSEVSRLLWRPSAARHTTVQVSRGNEVKELKFPKR
ncbi:MAG: Flp pilus assembly protein CpaB [Alphaproteobacteria bacterium]|nr:MAG: Flp pilus assembly protein CpaB [Alphaproteobacteria bacterium]